MTGPPKRFDSTDDLLGLSPPPVAKADLGAAKVGIMGLADATTKKAAPARKAAAAKKKAPATKAAAARRVRPQARTADERAVIRDEERSAWKASWDEQITAAWKDSCVLTPRQAAALVYILNAWADTLEENLQSSPVHEVAPFCYLDKRVLLLIESNKAWIAMVKDRCHAVADEIEKGVIPFDRVGCFFDEVIMGCALREVEDFMADQVDLLEGIPERLDDEIDPETATVSDVLAAHLRDDDWVAVSDSFDDDAYFPEWEIPSMIDHPLLGAVLKAIPVTEWFNFR